MKHKKKKAGLVGAVSLALLVTVLLFQPRIPGEHTDAVITSGSNVLDVLGQLNSDNSLSNPEPIFDRSRANNSPSKYGLYQPNDAKVDHVNHKLYVTDSNNHRVVVYDLNASNELIDYLPDYVLGAPSFSTYISAPTANASGLNYPMGLEIDPVRKLLFVTQPSFNRVSVFDVATITNGEDAVYVLGQPDFTTTTANVTQSGLSDPQRVALDFDTNYLFVSQATGNRVTVYDTSTITNGENAIHVLGQPNFTSTAVALTAAGMNRAHGLDVDEDRDYLFVTDEQHHRVLVYDISTISDGEDAIFVLGAPNMTSFGSFLSQTGMFFPLDLTLNGTNDRLFVAQASAARITVYDVATITNGEAAINVLGQTDFTSNSTGFSADKMHDNTGVGYNNSTNELYNVEKAFNHRIGIFDVTSIADGEAAVSVLGQLNANNVVNPTPTFAKHAINGVPTPLGFNYPSDVVVDQTKHRMYVADNSGRVVMFLLDDRNELIDRVPDAVLGQASMSFTTNAATQSTMSYPALLALDEENQRLFVGDESDNRIVVYDVNTVENGEPAIHVLGQTDFTSTTSGTSATKLNYVAGLAYDPVRQYLFVSEYNNRRVVVFDVATITDGEPAIHVLGAPDFVSVTSNLTATSLVQPWGVAYDSDRKYLFVGDYSGLRTLVFDVETIVDGEAAAFVLGQADFTTNTDATTQVGQSYPLDLAYDAELKRLFIHDDAGRVLVYDLETITNGELATHVFGAPDFTTSVYATGINTIQGGYGIDYDPLTNRVIVTTYGNRVVFFDAGVANASFEESEGSTTLEDQTTPNFTAASSDTIGIMLSAKPQSNVVFTVSISNSNAATVSPTTITFTPQNWYEQQVITVQAVHDEDADNDTVTIRIAVDQALSDNDFDAIPVQEYTVTITDSIILPSETTVLRSGGGGGYSATAKVTTIGDLRSAASEENTIEVDDSAELEASTDDCTNAECVGVILQVPAVPQIGRPIPSPSDASLPQLSKELCKGQSLLEIMIDLAAEPNKAMSRGKLIDLLLQCRSLEQTVDFSQRYLDVTENDEFIRAILLGTELGIIQGYPDGKFRSEQTVTKEEALKMMLLALFPNTALVGDTLVYSDVDDNAWYARYVHFAHEIGILSEMLTDARVERRFNVGQAMTYRDVRDLFMNVTRP